MKQRGIGTPEAVVICVIIIIIGLLGWKFMDMNQQKTETQNTKNSSKSSDVESIQKDESVANKISAEDDKVAATKVACSVDNDQATDAVARFSSKYTEVKDGKYAHFSGACSASDEEAMSGFHAFMYKENGKWTRLTAGNGELLCNDLESKKFPKEFIEICQGPSLE
jgi:cytoskeletal protein RodZ